VAVSVIVGVRVIVAVSVGARVFVGVKVKVGVGVSVGNKPFRGRPGLVNQTTSMIPPIMTNPMAP
jgi:hypothetical protein